MKAMMYSIINDQNAQIQAMRGVLEALNLPETDDCEVTFGSQAQDERSLNRKLTAQSVTAAGALFAGAAHLF
jgi:hypothetical protein